MGLLLMIYWSNLCIFLFYQSLFLIKCGDYLMSFYFDYKLKIYKIITYKAITMNIYYDPMAFTIYVRSI